MIKLLKIKSLGNNRFDVTFSENGTTQQRVIKYGTHEIESDDNLTMSFIVPDDKTDKEFFDLLGSEKAFRQGLLARIKTEITKQPIAA